MAARAMLAAVVFGAFRITTPVRAQEPGGPSPSDTVTVESPSSDETFSGPDESSQNVVPAIVPTTPPGVEGGHAPPDARLVANALAAYAQATGSDPTVIRTSERRLVDVYGNPFLVLVEEVTDAPLLVGDRTLSADWSWREASLGILGDKRSLLVGAAGGGTNMSPGDFERIQSIQTREFRLSLVYQDMSTVEPNEYDFHFETLNWLLQTARDHDMPVLLHPLVWHSVLPSWLAGKTEAELRRALVDYVRATLSQLGQAGSIGQPMVVVVNEAYGAGDVLFQRLGPEYVELAFATARDAHPSALLLYNDYDNHTKTRSEFGTNNYQKTKMLVERLRAKGLIDGVGTQMYVEGSNPPLKSEVVEALMSYGLPIYVTEFAVNMRFVEGTTADRLDAQARIYQTMTEACVESAVCRAFIDFQLGDRFSVHENLPSLPSYSKNSHPTPYDDNLRPKPALYAQRRALLQGLPPA